MCLAVWSMSLSMSGCAARHGALMQIENPRGAADLDGSGFGNLLYSRRL
jgi:hypothetical protein